MSAPKPKINMPELLVFAKMFIVGFAAAEIGRSSYYLGTAFAPVIADYSYLARGALVIVGLAICVVYVHYRGALNSVRKIYQSHRVDLLIAFFLGALSTELTMPWLCKFHGALRTSNPYSATVLLFLLCTILVSPVVGFYWHKRRRDVSNPIFLEDDAIKSERDDVLGNAYQAEVFANAVLTSEAHPGLVFGIDGPWGIGKSSFVNLAQEHWARSSDKVVVCKIDHLHYASEPDLVDRMIRQLTASIQREVFAPEFRSAATRYSRLLNGKVDVSFLGFKFSLEPSRDTIDEMLDDLDDLLRRVGRRLIVVIDDLDRLDPKSVNNVLFALKRTFKLSQAVYVLCYDAEVLAASQDEGIRSRQFFEKYVNVKISLFASSSSLSDFLRRDWVRSESQIALVPSDMMVKLGEILSELADVLNHDSEANYLALIGDIRKIKRFINAILVLQIEKTDFGRTDFNKRDLINLMLLHLHYPGLFRRIYAEETEGRVGSFSARRRSDGRGFVNASGLPSVVQEYEGMPASFLLNQLFNVEAFGIDHYGPVDEPVLRSRACFNSDTARNLENYLKLIVRFVHPVPKETYAFYRSAVDQARKGKPIALILGGKDFVLKGDEFSHDEFWRILVNQANDFTIATAVDAIDTLVDYLPRYSTFDYIDRGLRSRSIYSLLLLLDRAGWDRGVDRRNRNTPENVNEIACRIFGEQAFVGNGLIERLASPNRGVLGWNDLMLFRLQCSADSGAQVYDLQRALMFNQDMTAPQMPPVAELAKLGMRKLSQRVFALFKRTYIDARRNFIAEAYQVPAEEFLGQAYWHRLAEPPPQPESVNSDKSPAQQAAVARAVVASFVISQLSNSQPPKGSGVGCGFYDEIGVKDCQGIAKVMNDYVFQFCFNPQIDSENVFIFIDFCLSQLSNSLSSGSNVEGYVPTTAGLLGGFDSKAMGMYWSKHRAYIGGLALQNSGRCVYLPGYKASYRDHLQGVFSVLDTLAEKATSS